MRYLIQPFIQIVDVNGTPVVGAKIYVKVSDTTESVITYNDFEGHLNPDPIITDLLGNATIIVNDDCGLCDVYVYDNNDNLLMTKKYISPGDSSSIVSVDLIEGYGIEISGTSGNYVIGVNSDIIATQEDLNNKQDKLSGGANIEISSNTVSVTGRKSIYTVSPLYARESNSAIYFGLETSSMTPASALNNYVTTAQYQSDSATFLTGVDLSDYSTVDWVSGQLNNKLNTSSFDSYTASVTSYVPVYYTVLDKLNGFGGNVEYKDYISLSGINGHYPRFVVGSIDWSSTDGNLSFIPTSSISDTANIVPIDISLNNNVKDASTTSWNTMNFNCAVNDPNVLRYIAIKGGVGQNCSIQNIKLTCIY